MIIVEITQTSRYSVELTDEIMENFCNSNQEFGNSLEGAALWALENVYGWDSNYDYEIESEVSLKGN